MTKVCMLEGVLGKALSAFLESCVRNVDASEAVERRHFGSVASLATSNVEHATAGGQLRKEPGAQHGRLAKILARPKQGRGRVRLKMTIVRVGDTRIP
jgi:hypothetical protein